MVHHSFLCFSSFPIAARSSDIFFLPNNLIKQKIFYIYHYKLILQKIFCIAFSAIKVYRALMELPIIKLAGIMGNKRGHVKDNHPQKPKKLLDLAKEI